MISHPHHYHHRHHHYYNNQYHNNNNNNNNHHHHLGHHHHHLHFHHPYESHPMTRRKTHHNSAKYEIFLFRSLYKKAWSWRKSFWYFMVTFSYLNCLYCDQAFILSTYLNTKGQRANLVVRRFICEWAAIKSFFLFYQVHIVLLMRSLASSIRKLIWLTRLDRPPVVPMKICWRHSFNS